MPVFRTVLRWSIIAGLGVGAAAFVLGPHRVAAACAQVQSWGQNTVDRFVEDPVALRRQLEQLGAEYPGRIGQLRGELVQLDRQVRQLSQDCEVSRRVVMATTRQLSQDCEVSRRVVAMTTADLDQVQAALADATVASEASVRPASSRGRSESNDVGNLKSEAKRIQQIRAAHHDRLSTGERQVSMLRDQRAKLSAVLQKLEREHSDFQIKLAALDRQIDAVGRNKRLIEMAKEQAQVLAEYERGGRIGNLGQLEGRLEQLRMEQEAQLEVLLRCDDGDPYESAAREAIRNGEVEDQALPAPSTVLPSSLQANVGSPVIISVQRP